MQAGRRGAGGAGRRVGKAEGYKDYGVDTVKGEGSGVIGCAGEVDGQEKAEGEMKGRYVVEFISL